jgi:lipopolysaccharide transport system ATP-binding protein
MSNDNEILVKVDGVSKKFCRDLKKSLWYGVKDVVSELNPFQRNSSDLRPSTSESSLRPGEFWANKDISFELRRGECLGLIGSNGAGKTTLLKMLNGLIKPDEGSITMRGRVGALIALGAGFNPILTGRENIYVNGSILGLTKREIDDKIEDIIEFSEIRDFIDSPVQSYSSGMQVRLGFAVATAMDPDVLILDEVLAVGDVNFRTKCFIRISSLLANAAVIFVSHSEEQLSRICQSGLVLHKGIQLHAGNLPDCLQAYQKASLTANEYNLSYCHQAIENIEIQYPKSDHVSGDDLSIEIHYNSKNQFTLSLYAFALLDASGNVVSASDLLAITRQIRKGNHIQKFKINALSLKSGIYTSSIEVIELRNALTLVRKRFNTPLNVSGSFYYWSNYTPVVSMH